MISYYSGSMGCVFLDFCGFTSRFWKIPETAWWRWRPARRLTSPKPIFWVSSMYRLAARCGLPGDTNWLAQFLAFLGVPVMWGRLELFLMIWVYLVCCYYLWMFNWWKHCMNFTRIWDLGFILELGMNNNDVYEWCTVCVELMITWLDYEVWMLCACESMLVWRGILKSEWLQVTLGAREIWQNPNGHAPPSGTRTAARWLVKAVAS